MAWTDDRVEILKKLWTEGLSASQIARQMGEVTRNAVIGKVHRLGLSGRATPARVTTAKVNTATRNRPNQLPMEASNLSYNADGGLQNIEEPAVPESLLSPEERASILNLTEHTCKWPVGDPGTKNFHFCGARSKPNGPYCKIHATQAYQTMDRRRKRKIG